MLGKIKSTFYKERNSRENEETLDAGLESEFKVRIEGS